MTVLTRHLIEGGSPEVNISDLEYTYEGGLKSFRPQHEDVSTRQWKLVNVVVHLLTVTH